MDRLQPKDIIHSDTLQCLEIITNLRYKKQAFENGRKLNKYLTVTELCDTTHPNIPKEEIERLINMYIRPHGYCSAYYDKNEVLLGYSL